MSEVCGDMKTWTYPMKPIRIDVEMFLSRTWDGYSFERKYDGHRAIVIMNGSPQIWTRQGNRIETPDNLVPQLRELNLPSGTRLDGEIWTPSKRGSWRHSSSVKCKLTMWDVMRHGREDLSQLPLEKRRQLLQSILSLPQEDISVVQPEPPTPETLREVMRTAKDHWDATEARSGFIHGVVLKRDQSPRRDHPKRSIEHPDWLKICFRQSGDVR